MERKKRSKGRGWESCYVKKIYGTFGVEMRSYGQKLVKLCTHTHTHTRVSYSSIDFFNGWFRLHVRNNLFCLFNKVPDLTTAMDWFAVCSAHELKIFPDIIYFQMHLCVSPCFCSGSTFHVHVAVALLNFFICCLP